jgi:DNA-binding response OmpR family regulator
MNLRKATSTSERQTSVTSSHSFIAVVGHGPELEREGGAAGILRSLGAQVRTLDLWEDPAELFYEGDGEDLRPRAVLVEAGDRPDLATAALRSLRRQMGFEGVGSIIAVTTAQVARLDPSAGFDDFVLMPFVPAELYARIRALEWRRSEFATEERLKVGAIVVDKAAREVMVGGRAVSLTAKEFALLAYLCERRGKAMTRDQLLAKVWGTRYEGGPRTVDIHVRRLRAKLGDDFPLETLRGAGYKLRAPLEGEGEGARKRH